MVLWTEVKKSALRSSRQSWSTITDPRSMFYSDHRSPIPQLVRRITDPTSPIHFSKSCCHLFKSPQQQKKVVWDYFWSKIRIHYFVSKERLLRLLLVENKNLLLRQKKKVCKTTFGLKIRIYYLVRKKSSLSHYFWSKIRIYYFARKKSSLSQYFWSKIRI